MQSTYHDTQQFVGLLQEIRLQRLEMCSFSAVRMELDEVMSQLMETKQSVQLRVPAAQSEGVDEQVEGMQRALVSSNYHAKTKTCTFVSKAQALQHTRMKTYNPRKSTTGSSVTNRHVKIVETVCTVQLICLSNVYTQ